MDMARINQRIDELEELINLLKQDRISEIAEKCTYGSLSAGQAGRRHLLRLETFGRG